MTFYKFAVGVVLAAAMIAVLFMSALVFSSRDFQYGVAQVAPSTNGLVSFQRLNDVGQMVDQLREQSDVPRGELLELEARRSAFAESARSAQTLIGSSRSTIVGGIAELEQNANIQSNDSAADDTSAQLEARLQRLSQQAGLTPGDQQRAVSLLSQVQQLRQEEASVSASDADRASTDARYILLVRQVGEADARIFALQQSVVSNYEQFDRIRGEAAALQGLSRLGISADLAQGHPALLSTFLVLLMGALGALLYLFPAYLNRAAPVTMAEIVVRLMFGMCAALAAYVLTNAAISTFQISDTQSAPATSAGLNPFAVSLIGIVAGVLSEDIAKWIQERGRGVLQINNSGAGNVAAPPPVVEPSATGGLVNNDALNN